MRRYAKYKDSGVEWIGDIPEGWTIKRIGSVFEERKENVSDKDYPPLSVSKIGVVPQLDGVAKTDNNDNRKLVKKGDFVINSRSDRKGSSGFSLLDGSVSVINIVLKPTYNQVFPKYSHFLFKSYFFIEEFFKNGRGIVLDLWSTRFNEMRYMLIPLPPLKEQEQIVAYLDEKTSHIDKLLDISKRKIGLLKEQRSSIINQVVTKGLNPNAKMKHSGVEWIGDIPEGWGVNKVGNNTYVKGRIGWKGLKSEDFLDEGPYLVTGTDFNKDGTINWANIYHVSNERYDEDPFIQLKDNDVLITKDGTIGKVVYVGNLLGKTCLNSGIFLTRPTNGQYISRYFFWVLNSNVFKVFVYFNSNGATIQHLYQNVFINFKFPIPPLEEQEKIVAYLDEKTSIIDKSISIEERRIGLLKEYRQSIISQVITGKIKVIADE